jgi:hypothetical protein
MLQQQVLPQLAEFLVAPKDTGIQLALKSTSAI